jgi:predicted ATPase
MKIVITGAPSAGKTAVVEILSLSHCDKLTFAQEAASILFRGGFPRLKTVSALQYTQRAIYFLQRELENLVEIEDRKKPILCDRGSLDVLAYWPAEELEFFSSLQTSMENEIARYDLVFHLSPAAPYQSRFDSSRIETPQEIEAIDRRIVHAWRQHGNRLFVPKSLDFVGKVNFITRALDRIVSPSTATDARVLDSVF